MNAWRTTTLEISSDLEAPFMKMIKLPLLKSYKIAESVEDSNKVSAKLMQDLITDHSVVACIVQVQLEFYCRISCYVYNQLEDYVKLKDAILKLI